MRKIYTLGSLSSRATLTLFLRAAQVSGQQELAPPIEVIARNEGNARRLEQSSDSVKVVETRRAQRQSADLGEVLARAQGIGVRRSGGVGSGTRFSLNGLTDNQVRFFLDGLPLELSGYPFGVANVPVNLVKRVEVYSGVVPLRFGADALGGAVNLVTRGELRGSHAHASYEIDSFSNHRLTLGAQHRFYNTHLYLRANGFVDSGLNRYPIDVLATDERGQLYPVRVRRFHDRYRAAGANVELGLVNRPWAKRLMFRGFVSSSNKELQSNFPMTIPYGGVSRSERTFGANLRYEHNLGETVFLDAVVGYTHLRGNLLDVDPCIYNWFGECLFEGRRGGETDSVPHDSLNWDNSGYARLNLQWLPAYDHEVRVVVAPTFLRRTGDERRPLNPEERDPLTARRALVTIVSGVEYQADFLDGDLENVLFAKHYGQILDSEEPPQPFVVVDTSFRAHERTTQHPGVGNSLRYRFNEELVGKLAYEWATRLPRPEEVFGDAVLIRDNFDLRPEVSHNVNLGAQFESSPTTGGDYRATVNLFLRELEQLIFLTGDDFSGQSYQNVYSARSQGIEASAGWTLPHEYLSLNTNFTYQSFRNTSSKGSFGDFNGDRIPNRPYVFANGSARFQLKQLAAPHDELSLTWHSRYVREFFRSWESVGLRESKQVIPSQLVHSLSLVYLLKSQALTSSSSLEVQNLGDARVYDFFGAQRPGRAVFLKTTLKY